MTRLLWQALWPRDPGLGFRHLLLAGSVVLLVTHAPPLSAQGYNFHHYTNRDGLPQSQVLTMHQDHEGYLWFGTYGGLGRYDGAAIRAYTSADGLSSNVVVSMTEDRDGRLYLGTLGGGLCVMEGGAFHCLSRSDGLPADDITDVLVDREGALWVATPQGLARRAPAHDPDAPVESFTVAEGLPSNQVLVLAMDGDGQLWVGTERGLATEDDGSFRIVRPGALENRPIQTLLPLPGRLLVGTDQALHLMETRDPGTLRAVDLPGAPGAVAIRGAARDGSGSIWVATDRGLVRIEDAQVTLLTQENGLPLNDLQGVMVDREENVWVGYDSGASKLLPGPFLTWGPREGLPNPFARALAEDGNGRLWVGTRTGAAAWSPEEDRFQTTVPAGLLRDPRIYSAAPSPEGGMLVGSREGLVHHHQGSVQIFYREDGLPADYVLSLLPDGQGAVWIGTESGLARWERGQVTPFPPDHPLQGLFAVTMRLDEAGRLWIGLASGGVRIWDGESLQVLDREAGLTDQVIWSLSPDPTGGMWVGTNGDGAFHVTGTGIRRYTSTDGLVNDFVWQVLADSRGDVWFYTNQGLDRLREGSFRHFGEADGLMDLEGTAAAALEDSEGRLWFGTGQGVMVFDPEREHVNRVPPPTRIQEVTLAGQPLDLGDELRFDPSLIQFRFGALTFRDEESVRFRHRLIRGEGDDEPWSALTPDRTVSYAGLPPGRYTFQVTAINGDGVVSEEPASLTFTVLPRWWQTWWFRFLAVGLLASGAAGVPILRSRRLEAERRRLEVEVAERTSELERANQRLRGEIRERERFEAELQASETRLRQIVENSTIVFYSHTPENELTYISPQVEEILGVPPEKVPARWTEFATDHPINERGVAITRRALETGERQPPYELELRHDSGRLVRVRVTEAPVVQNGKSVAMVGSLTDITETRKAEEERARLEERLRQAQRLEAVGRLAGGIAHGFNNLLTAIVGRADLMALELDRDHPLQEDLEEVTDACDRAAGLVGQLLALGRQQMIQPEARNVNQEVRRIEQRLKETVGPEVSLETRLSPDAPWIHMDPAQLLHVLVQVVRNAREAMPNGGEVTVSTDRMELDAPPDGVEEPGFTPGDFALLEVVDTGPGMTPETAERAFEPFFTTKEMAEGAGLGLATVYGIVKQNSGHIQLDTAPAQGTRIRIYLPATGRG